MLRKQDGILDFYLVGVFALLYKLPQELQERFPGRLENCCNPFLVFTSTFPDANSVYDHLHNVRRDMPV